MSAPFISDVGKNRRAPLTEERLVTLVVVLNLNKAEKAEMYDIVGQQKGLLAPDLNPYVNNRPYVSAALRTARTTSITCIARYFHWCDFPFINVEI